MMILNTLLVYLRKRQWNIFTYGIITEFPHAVLDSNLEPIYVWPPEDFFPFRRTIHGDLNVRCTVCEPLQDSGNNSSQVNFFRNKVSEDEKNRCQSHSVIAY
ncbi:MAG: hypothetical protein ACKPKO_21815, partial [Candidatus Fonsibacter sp.]